MTIVYFILILGITIFIHEFGHFIFAKKSNVYVYEFSLGMGPVLKSFKRKNDETTYSIRLFPIGGFVAMAGEDEEDEEVDKKRQVTNKSFLQKFSIFVAGVLFNFILAFILLIVVGLLRGAPSFTPIVGEISEEYNAYETNLKTGDVITSFNDKKISTTDDMSLALALFEGETAHLEVKHMDGTTESITIEPTYNEEEDANYYGFAIGESDLEFGILPAIKYAGIKFVSLIKQMSQIVFYLITGQLGLDSLAGPVGIYTIVDSVKSSISNILYLVAYLCINVGYINLLPIPAFDGAKILLLIIEKITKKKMNPKVENIIANVSFALLMILLVFITFNDIIRLK